MPGLESWASARHLVNYPAFVVGRRREGSGRKQHSKSPTLLMPPALAWVMMWVIGHSLYSPSLADQDGPEIKSTEFGLSWI